MASSSVNSTLSWTLLQSTHDQHLHALTTLRIESERELHIFNPIFLNSSFSPFFGSVYPSIHPSTCITFLFHSTTDFPDSCIFHRLISRRSYTYLLSKSCLKTYHCLNPIICPILLHRYVDYFSWTLARELNSLGSLGPSELMIPSRSM